jgi:hypothetical protein
MHATPQRLLVRLRGADDRRPSARLLRAEPCGGMRQMPAPKRGGGPIQIRLAIRVGLWMCLLPLRLRVYPLPVLLHSLTRSRRTHSRNIDMEQAVRTVVHLCRLGLFRLPIFPRLCLRQALALHYVLTRLGYPAEIHFGVRKAGGDLHGHSWVTVQGCRWPSARERTSLPLSTRTRRRETTVYRQPTTAHAKEGLMANAHDRPSPPAQEAQGLPPSATSGKEPWQEPKLTFVEPTLTKHGSLQEVTGQGFFGGFTPTP